MKKTNIYSIECFVRNDGIVMATTGFHYSKSKNHGFYSYDTSGEMFVEYYHKILFSVENKNIYLYDRDRLYVTNCKSEVKSTIRHSKIRHSKLFDYIEVIKPDLFERLIVVNY